MAAAGAQAQGGPPRRDGSIQADAYRSWPRPVYIDMPPEAAVEREEVELRNPAPVSRIVPSPEDLREAARVIAQAQLPVIFAGGGVALSDAEQALVRLARSDKHTGDHVRRRQGSHPGQPSAMLRVLPQPRC